jgi:transposase
VASINRVWRKRLGVEQTVIEGWDFDELEEALLLSVRPMGRGPRRCSVCGRRCPGYDQGAGRRRWRGLALSTVQVFLEAEAPRVIAVGGGEHPME